ncbi:uncharacterized protein LOC133778764 [Humulus lupulus]|uniref:uncharacterized protein LOC133778764 n=1 Tax=Humulus lupulus TaxID=3486 RepID=UPI002B40B1C9|nr:uncharacterized protein LOC133778764 [Humulus lupulus]
MVGLDTNINFWNQPWIPWLDYAEFKGTMEQLRHQNPILKGIKDIFNVEERRWNSEVITRLFEEELGRRICDIQLLPEGHKDKVVWKPNNSGNFSMKSAYYLDQCYKFNDVNSVWKWLWGPGIHPRLSMVLWRTIFEALPTKDKMRFLREQQCDLCSHEQETTMHIFKNCPFARAIWFSGPFAIRSDMIPSNNFKYFVITLLENHCRQLRKEIASYIACYVEVIWRVKNEAWSGVTTPTLSRAIWHVHQRFGECKNSATTINANLIWNRGKTTQMADITLWVDVMSQIT